jgi:hypothetical protein
MCHQSGEPIPVSGFSYLIKACTKRVANKKVSAHLLRDIAGVCMLCQLTDDMHSDLHHEHGWLNRGPKPLVGPSDAALCAMPAGDLRSLQWREEGCSSL